MTGGKKQGSELKGGFRGESRDDSVEGIRKL